MISNYVCLRSGHYYQMFKTGPGPEYNKNYISYWDSMNNEPLSIIRYNLLTRHIKSFDSILDFGYGNGNFLSVCQKHGKNCFGYDISDYPLPDGIKFVFDIKHQPVDVVSFFDSLEHLTESDLVTFLLSIPTKHLIISVPHFHEQLGANWFTSWKHRKPNEHFHHFDIEGLTGLLKEADYDTIYCGNDEDVIRRPVDHNTNILTVIAKKR